MGMLAGGQKDFAPLEVNSHNVLDPRKGPGFVRGSTNIHSTSIQCQGLCHTLR